MIEVDLKFGTLRDGGLKLQLRTAGTYRGYGGFLSNDHDEYHKTGSD
jgi:muconolactone delta-isomerase